MNRTRLEDLLEAVATGRLGVQPALAQLEDLPYADVEGYAKLDHHRELRHGVPEVVFGQGKSPEQQARIAERLLSQGQNLLITRSSPEAHLAVTQVAPQAVYHPAARAITAEVAPRASVAGLVGIVAAGTSDLPVAEEAAVTAMALGLEHQRIYDVGVAGIHRLLAQRTVLKQARVLIVIAGMEGALPSVVGGLCGQPVIAVPTSVGYGVGAGGLAALLGMLSSCAPGILVTNIDNGFGAAYAAYRMLRTASRDAL